MVDLKDLGLMVGKGVHAVPFECKTSINFTAPLGSCTGLYYGLCFFLSEEGYNVQKVDEYVEVKPGSTLYERTMAQKGRLGQVINKSMDEIAQVVADYELVEHDLRKYKEMMDYFEKGDEHSLKTMFVEKVDVHSGASSILSMARERWPTIYTDFLELNEKHTSVDKVMKDENINVSKAEAVVLVTKNKLYLEWKELFKGAIRNRYKRLRGLLASKKKTIDYYKDWLTPYIARYRTIREKYAKPERVKSEFQSFISSAEVSSSNHISLWVWDKIKIAEKHKATFEQITPEQKEKSFPVDPYDDFIKRELIFKKEGNSLAADHPWITKKWVDEQVKSIKGNLDPERLYYAFIELEVDRSTLAMPGGKEIGDIVFNINTHLLSQNLLLVKLLELKAKAEEFQRYIDQMIGVKEGSETVESLVEKEYPGIYSYGGNEPEEYEYSPSLLDHLREMFGDIFMFVKGAPYETNFADRTTKMMIKEAAGAYGDVTGYLKSNMGVP